MDYTQDQLRFGVQKLSEEWHRTVVRAGLQDVMKEPIFELTVNTRNWGTWNPGKRVLAVQARLAVLWYNSYTFRDTVRHEIAHQYVSEVVKNTHETYHGPTWKSAAKMFGADPKASAIDTLDQECADPSSADTRVIHKIQKLLALSSSCEENEAHLAALRAQELMQKHQISTVSEASGGVWNFRMLGEPMKQRPRWMGILAKILHTHYNVKLIWIPHTSYHMPEHLRQKVKKGGNKSFALEVTGTAANVEIAEHVYNFLLAEGERRVRGRGMSRTERLDFLIGMYQGFLNKLDDQAKRFRLEKARRIRESQEVREKEEHTGALVKHQDEELQRFYERRHPRIRSTYASERKTYHGAARNAGLKAGRNLSINPAVTNGSRGRSLT